MSATEALIKQRIMPQPPILPIRVIRTKRPPITFQEGTAALERYIQARDARLGVRRTATQPKSSPVSSKIA